MRTSQYMPLSRNFGHQVALSAGIDTAESDAAILMDSDLQHPPELIPKMLDSCFRGGFDVVSAVRRCTRGAGFLKRITSQGFYWLFNHLSETRVEPGAADFCLLSRRAYRALRSMPERHRFLRGMVAWIGFRRSFLEYEAAERFGGRSKYSLTRMVRLAADAVFSFTTKPVRLATRLGLATVACGLVYLVYTVARAIFWRDTVPGWASLIGIVLILGGAQLAFVGLLGEYISRVFEEVKSRPLYLFKQGPDRDAGAGLRRQNAPQLQDRS
jgi:polyisoprenyl-phosphate glycosyltransferase